MADSTSRPIPEIPPALPSRPAEESTINTSSPFDYRPPTRQSVYGNEDVSNPIHYTRDPHKLIAYIIPFPKPDIHAGFLHKADSSNIPDRFLIYTPPPPPLTPPKEGEKEGKLHKVQRKWQEEVREAKTSNAKVTSWKGVKGRVTKGVNVAMGWTTTSNLDFLNRVPGSKSTAKAVGPPDPHAENGYQEHEYIHKTVGLEEMILVHPSAIPGTETQIRKEFVDSMLRSKSKAERDAIIATGLMPVTFAIDVLAMIIWPFGGLLEIDSVWAYSSIRGAKTARSVTKRLNSSSEPDAANDNNSLKLTFAPSPRLDVLRKYLEAECHKRDPKLFKGGIIAPTETEVLEAIGWSPSQTNGETRNWEDEQWEISEVKDDLKQTMHKGAKEWDKWCKVFEKDPKKALKK